MFVFYRLFCRCVDSAPSNGDCPSSSTSSESSIPPSDPEKDRAILLWWAAFGFTLFFRPAAELVIRTILFSTCTSLIGTLDVSLNLLVGHAVLRAAKYNGYDPPLLSSLDTGLFGGSIVIWPTILATVFLIALLGSVKLQRFLSRHMTLLLELASAITVSTAACSVGVVVIQHTRPENGPLLDATHAARAGALGACILTVPILSTAAFFVCKAQTMPSARNEPSTPPADLADSPGCPENHVAASSRIQSRGRALAHTAAETAAYIVVILCILTVRLLCF